MLSYPLLIVTQLLANSDESLVIASMSQISWNAVDNDSVHSVMLDYKADDNDWISISDNEVNDGSMREIHS